MYKQMKRFKVILAIVVLVVSLVLLFDKIFTPQPIQIVLQSGQEITTQNSDYFTLTEMLLLITCAFLVGAAATYLFYNSDKFRSLNLGLENIEPKTRVMESEPVQSTILLDKYETILPLLKDDEKKVLLLLRDAGGEMLQNQLVLKLNESKVKVTRVLDRLEEKNLIIKERNGLTNNIKVK